MTLTKPKWTKPVLTELPDPPQSVKDAFARQLASRQAALPASDESDRRSARDDTTGASAD